MINQKLVQLLESVLGKGIKLKKNGEYKFQCPAHTETHGPKLQIQLDTTENKYQAYHCWVCGFRGEKLNSLFKRLNINSSELNEILGVVDIKNPKSKFDKLFNKDNKKQYTQLLSLPDEFIPLWTEEYSWSPDFKHARKYIIQTRGLTEMDIFRYRIGYAEKGQYAGMVIIPSYDEKGLLNFYTGRSIYNTVYKHKKPNVSNDIVGFELFINWNLPVTLVEGVFDAISVKNNAIPLFGKQISNNLKMKLLQSNVPQINFALDMDAMKDGMKYAKQFMGNGKKVTVVEMKGKDPNAVGFDKMQELIVSAKEFSINNLLKYKILNKI